MVFCFLFSLQRSYILCSRQCYWLTISKHDIKFHIENIFVPKIKGCVRFFFYLSSFCAQYCLGLWFVNSWLPWPLRFWDGTDISEDIDSEVHVHIQSVVPILEQFHCYIYVCKSLFCWCYYQSYLNSIIGPREMQCPYLHNQCLNIKKPTVHNMHRIAWGPNAHVPSVPMC